MTPQVQILANRQDISAMLLDRLLSLRITDEAGIQADTVEIQLDDRDGMIEWPPAGAELDIRLGMVQGELIRMGLYVVDELEHQGPPWILTMRGKATDMGASFKAPKSRSWDAVTLATLVQTMAAEHQLQPNVSPDLAGFVIDHLDQTQESDLHLLTRVARSLDAVAKPVAGYLVCVPKGEAKSATGLSLLAIDLSVGQWQSHRMTQSERSRYAAVQAHWQDYDGAAVQTVTVGEGDPVFQIRHPLTDAESATQAARAKWSLLQRGTATLSLTLPGRLDIQAEGRIRLSGIRPPVAGDWVVERVEHQLNDQGLTTRVEARLPKD